MADIVTISASGRLGQDPELKFIGDKATPLSSFTIAVGRYSRGENVTDWYSCKAWGKVAERCASWLKKGDRVFVTGSMEIETWQDKDGQKRTKPVIVVSDFVPGANREQQQYQSVQTTPYQQPVQKVDLDDIPY